MEVKNLKVVFIHCVESADRYQNICQVANAFQLSDYDVQLTCDKPFLTNVANKISRRSDDWAYGGCNDQEYYRQLDCLQNHYTAVKCALLQGVEYLMVVEDDVVPMAGRAELDDALRALPRDWQLAQFHPIWHGGVDGWPLWNRYDALPPGGATWGTQMYVMNRQGMKFYLDFIDGSDQLQVADAPLLYMGEKACAHYVYNGCMIGVRGESLIHESVVHGNDE